MTDRHAHTMVPQEIIAPTMDGGHTRFFALICPCGHTELFPYFNFTLTTPAFQAAFVARLRIDDCFLVTPVPDPAYDEGGT